VYIVYVIQNDIDKGVYIGITTNLRQRVEQHNNGENKSTIRKSGKWILIYAEAYRNRIDAQLRERKLKSHGSGKHELYKRIQNSLIGSQKTGAGQNLG